MISAWQQEMDLMFLCIMVANTRVLYDLHDKPEITHTHSIRLTLRYASACFQSDVFVVSWMC